MRREESPETLPQMEEPPSDSLARGPRGSPVWKEKFFWTEWTGAKL